MSLTFPLSLAQFADMLPITAVRWFLPDMRELSGMGTGQILQADLAPQLWRGNVELAEQYHNDMIRIEARLNAIVRSVGSFYLYDPRMIAPPDDPTGADLSGFTPQINSLPNPSTMSLKGLPANYKLAAGTYLSWDYGSSPTRRAFHQIAEDIVANGSGVTAAFEVSPFVRPGSAVNANVTLVKPAMRCIIEPGSIDGGSTGNSVTSALSFAVVQKI